MTDVGGGGRGGGKHCSFNVRFGKNNEAESFHLRVSLRLIVTFVLDGNRPVHPLLPYSIIIFYCSIKRIRHTLKCNKINIQNPV